KRCRMTKANRVLVKLQTTVALAAADPRANLRPLFDAAPQAGGFGLTSAPAWYLAELPDGGPSPWDAAHAQVADQLGVDESAVLFAEPDLAQHFIDADAGTGNGQAFAAAPPDCNKVQLQVDDHGRIKGPHDFWHLDDDYSQLGR